MERNGHGTKQHNLHCNLNFKDNYLNESGCFKLIHDNKVDTLMHRWRHPCLSIHGKIIN